MGKNGDETSFELGHDPEGAVAPAPWKGVGGGEHEIQVVSWVGRTDLL
jgi:hypothetical protein